MQSPQVIFSLLFAISFLIATISCQSSMGCYKDNTCMSHRDTCALSWQTNATACRAQNGQNCCSFGLVCSNGECLTNTYNTGCSNDNQCLSAVPGESLLCTGKCMYRALVGDECGSGQTCEAGLSCTNGVCRGASSYSYCDSNIQCDLGLYCSNNSCKYRSYTNSYCTSTDQCSYGMFCYSSSSTCQPYYSLSYGEHCISSAQCQPGYACSGGQCQSSYSYNVYSTCYSDNYCSTGETCVCSKFTGTSYCIPLIDTNQVCSYEEYNVENCLIYSTASSISTNPGSRFMDSCEDEWEELQRCQCESSGTLLGSCSYNDYCGFVMPWWGTTLIVIGLFNCCFVYCGIICVCIYLCSKKRNSQPYATI